MPLSCIEPIHHLHTQSHQCAVWSLQTVLKHQTNWCCPWKNWMVPNMRWYFLTWANFHCIPIAEIDCLVRSHSDVEIKFHADLRLNNVVRLVILVLRLLSITKAEHMHSSCGRSFLRLARDQRVLMTSNGCGTLGIARDNLCFEFWMLCLEI
jgi:hypothetical protein